MRLFLGAKAVRLSSEPEPLTHFAAKIQSKRHFPNSLQGFLSCHFALLYCRIIHFREDFSPNLNPVFCHKKA